MTDLTKAKAALDGHSLAVCKGEQIKTFDGRGISPLVNAIEGGDLSGYSAADTVVGKAAALLMVKAGIVCAYAVNISMSAKAVFEAHNIYYEFTTLADKIMNRENTDVCPMEKTVAQIDDPEQAYCAIKQKLASPMAKK